MGRREGKREGGEGGRQTYFGPQAQRCLVVPVLNLLPNVSPAGSIAFDAPVAHRDAGWQPTTNAGRPRATVRRRWPFLALAPWPASERAPSRLSRREPCKLTVASDVDDSVPPSTQRQDNYVAT